MAEEAPRGVNEAVGAGVLNRWEVDSVPEEGQEQGAEGFVDLNTGDKVMGVEMVANVFMQLRDAKDIENCVLRGGHDEWRGGMWMKNGNMKGQKSHAYEKRVQKIHAALPQTRDGAYSIRRSCKDVPFYTVHVAEIGTETVAERGELPDPTLSVLALICPRKGSSVVSKWLAIFNEHVHTRTLQWGKQN